MATISAFGDSILKGVTMSEGRYVVSRPWDQPPLAGRPFSLDLHAKFGATIEGGRSMLEHQLARGGLGSYTLLEFGGNDSDFDWKTVAGQPDAEHDCRTPPARFTAIYGSLIDRAREMGSTPILMTLPPIDPQRYLDWVTRGGIDRAAILHWLGDVNAIYRWQEYYSLLVRELAHDKDCLLLDVRARFLSRPRYLADRLSADGIHPSPQGQQTIMEAVRAFARELVEREQTTA